jgi:hypothetical protein
VVCASRFVTIFSKDDPDEIPFIYGLNDPMSGGDTAAFLMMGFSVAHNSKQ